MASTSSSLAPARHPRRWITDWRPEDPDFWAGGGRRVARRNLVWSIVVEHIGFSVWLLWSVSAVLLVGEGFDVSTQQLFWLVAVPNLTGALVRLPYTVAVARFGGRSWTVASALLLLVPTGLFVVVVQRPDTPYWVLLLVAATAGVGGGNFASSMANINAFYPAAAKGTALGLNAAGGNLGVAVVQLLLPVLVGGAGMFGLVHASAEGQALERAGLVYAGLAVAAAVGAWLFMDNLSAGRATTREQAAVLRQRGTWVLSFLYLGTFGSFIGCSAALPLLIRLHFWVPTPAPAGTGVDFAHYAFLGALVGSVARPIGGRLADRYGGGRVTCGAFAVMTLGTLTLVWILSRLAANPHQEIAVAEANRAWFGWFLGCFLLVLTAAGAGNGSTYRMIPLVRQEQARATTRSGTPERAAALARATVDSSAVIGVAGTVGALGGFLVPMTFGAPWVADPLVAVRTAFGLFAGGYLVCLAVTWFCFVRRRFLVGRVPTLAHARI